MIGRDTYRNALLDAFPDIVRSEELAGQIADVVFSVPIRALENGDSAELPGLGVVGIDRGRGADCVSLHAEESLLKCILH